MVTPIGMPRDSTIPLWALAFSAASTNVMSYLPVTFVWTEDTASEVSKAVCGYDVLLAAYRRRF